MSLNSEPIPEENDLLAMIDAGIGNLNTAEEMNLTLDVQQIERSEQKKNNQKNG